MAEGRRGLRVKGGGRSLREAGLEEVGLVGGGAYLGAGLRGWGWTV